MWRSVAILTLFCATNLCYGKTQPFGTKTKAGQPPATDLRNGLSLKIGNFSLESLYHISKTTPESQNLIVAPLTIWTLLAVIANGATGNTEYEIRQSARLDRNKHANEEFQDISRRLQTNSSTVNLAKINTIFMDKGVQLEQDFRNDSLKYFDTFVEELDFSNKDGTAAFINDRISNFTHGRIPKLVDPSYFDQSKMVMVSAVYFKGQWTSPFNSSATEVRPFHDSNGRKIGEVKMMYNRYTYPFANIQELQARVIEIPYGQENRLSMLIMLPNPNVSLESLFLKFLNIPLNRVFKEMEISQKEYGDDEVDCLIPRFKIESDIFLNPILMKMGIYDMFNSQKAALYKMARQPMYVSKVIHKAEIEVTEEGTTASGVSAAEFANRIGIIRFEANRPFAYMIVEKTTNSIVFGGMYRHPILY